MKQKAIVAISVLIGILLTGCQVEKFSMPTWDVNLNVPLMNDYFYVSDLVDSVHFFADSANVMIFQTTGEVQTEQVGNIGIETHISTGTLPLISGQPGQAQFPFSDVVNGRELAYGLIASGRILAQFTEINPALTDVQITIAEFKDADGLPLVVQYGGSAGMQNVNLAGYHAGTPNSNTIIDMINVSILASSSLPDGTVIGNLNLIMNDNLTFSTFRGRLTDYPLDVEDNDTTVDIEYPWGAENAIELLEASIQMTLTNPMTFDTIMHGYFYAINNDTMEQDSIAIVTESGDPYIISGATSNIPAVTEIEFTNQVTRLLSLMPERIELRHAYFVITNSGTAIGELTSSDRINGDYVADAPLRFILHDALVSPKDSIEIEISADNRDTIRKNLLDGRMDLYMTNRLPVGAQATVYFGSDPNIAVDDTSTWDFTYTAGIQSYQTNSGEQLVSLVLPHDNMMLFTNPKVYMKLTFSFEETTTPITITASPADYIRVRSMLNVNVHVEEQ